LLFQTSLCDGPALHSICFREKTFGRQQLGNLNSVYLLRRSCFIERCLLICIEAIGRIAEAVVATMTIMIIINVVGLEMQYL
jgi:hypothetical protein